MSLVAASSALRRYQIDLHCAGLPLERNIHSLPQPAGPVKAANGGHLSGTEKQVAGCDKNSWLRPGNLREQAALWLRLTARHWGAGVVVMYSSVAVRILLRGPGVGVVLTAAVRV
jgi:hypothetical protein